MLYAAVFVLVALGTRYRPSFGIAALVILVPFAFYRDLGVTTVSFPKVALPAAIAGLILRRCNFNACRAPVAATLGFCALAVVAATALSIAQASYPGAALRETAKSIEYLAVFATVVVAARADPDDSFVRFAFAATSLAVSAFALLQELTGATSGFWVHGRAIPRISGPLEGPNQLSAYLGITLCVVAAFLCSRKATPLERVALPVGCLALTLTVSRAGVLAALVGLALVVLLSRGPLSRYVPISAAAGVGFGLALLGFWSFAPAAGASGLLGRFSSIAEAPYAGSVGTRSQLWRAAFALWRNHPLLGIGAGNFERELGRVGLPRVRTHANSLYVQSLVEGGVPLFLVTLASALAPIVRFAQNRFGNPLVLAAFAASVAFALHQSVDLLAFYPKVGESWWILLALGAARADAHLSASIVPLQRSGPAPDRQRAVRTSRYRGSTRAG